MKARAFRVKEVMKRGVEWATGVARAALAHTGPERFRVKDVRGSSEIQR